MPKKTFDRMAAVNRIKDELKPWLNDYRMFGLWLTSLEDEQLQHWLVALELDAPEREAE